MTWESPLVCWVGCVPAPGHRTHECWHRRMLPEERQADFKCGAGQLVQGCSRDWTRTCGLVRPLSGFKAACEESMIDRSLHTDLHTPLPAAPRSV
jgi:hypothetical protein